MSTISIELAHSVTAEADEAFSAFHDVKARKFLMADYVKDVGVEGSGVGSIYRMYVDNETVCGCVVELTEFFDADLREMRVRMIDTGNVVPFADYRSQVVVQSAGEGQSIVVIRSTFLPLGVARTAAEAIARENYTAVLRRLDQYLIGDKND